MDEDLRRAERGEDPERLKRLRERAGQVPYRVWSSDSEGRTWLVSDGWGTYESLGDAEDSLVSEDRREARRGDTFVVVWGFECGYLASARYAGDPPDPAEILVEEEDLFLAGELELRPTLQGGPPEYEDDRYDEIHE